jgi:hypothetical protein
MTAFKETVEAFDREEKNPELSAAGTYRLIYNDANGHERAKIFSKTEYSPKAKLLFNDITTALEEMGQSITEQEKRQVLIEILERLC